MAVGFTQDGNELQQIEDTIKDGVASVLNNTHINSNVSNECLECGELIPLERLQVVKNADYCLTCQKELDKLSQNTTSLYNRRANYHTQIR